MAKTRIDSLEELLRLHEGLRLRPYKCSAGRWTVGYGHNLEAHGEPVPDRITMERAEAYLAEDIATARRQCEESFPFFAGLGEVRQAVLADMCFNLGIAGLRGFKRTLAEVERGNYIHAGAMMTESKWAGQVGHRAVRLSRMMAYGRWPEG